MESYEKQPFKKYIPLKKLRLVASNKRSFKKQIYKSNFFVHSIKTLNLSLNELKHIAKIRGIKGYKSMSEERLIMNQNQ